LGDGIIKGGVFWHWRRSQFFNKYKTHVDGGDKSLSPRTTPGQMERTVVLSRSPYPPRKPEACGAFDDQQMADVLGIDGEEEFGVYCATVGKKIT
jgi:hypothetical protein